MKTKRIGQLRFCALSVGAVFLLAISPIGAASAQESALLEGYHDYDSGDVPGWACNAGGWAMDPDSPDEDVSVRILVDGIQVLDGVSAENYREDLELAWDEGTGGCPAGTCAFEVGLWDHVTPYEAHEITVEAQDLQTGEWYPLNATPKWLTCRTYDIYVFDTRTGETRQITNLIDSHEFNPRWSPDGKKIVHDRWDSDFSAHAVHITTVKSGLSVPLVGAEGGSYPTWSPNGRWIAFDRGADEGAALYIVPPAGGDPRLVREDAFMASWAPSSRRLAFHQPSDGSIWTTDLAGRSPAMVVERGNGPAWSPDGQWIALEVDGDLWKVAVAIHGTPLGDPIQLTGDPAWEGRPSWSADGQTIAFHAGYDGDSDIWTIPAHGGMPTRLTGTPDADDYDPNYSNNGRYVAYASYLAPAPPGVTHRPSPFGGHWQGVDVDGSDIRLTIAGPPAGPFRITWTESYITFCNGGPGIVTGTARLNEDDASLLEAELHVRCFTTGASMDFHVVMEYLAATNTLRITYEDGRFVICYRPGRGRVQSDARIVAAAEGDWLWTSDFAPWDTLTISIYESDHPGADLRWTGTKTADQGGFVHVLPEDTGGLDFELGNYVTVSDSFIEKGLLLESITVHTFDLDNEIMAGTAPAGRDVTAVAGMAAAETQASMTVVADGSGDWSADFTTIPFDITEAMRPWSFAWIFDEDGDANEANPPPAPRSLRTPNYYVVWSETNPEEVTCLSWRGSDNLVSVWAHPDYCTDEDLEFFGNSWASENEGMPGFFFQSLVGWGTTGTWVETGLEVAIGSECTGCGGPSGIPIATTHQFFEEESKADLIKVQREIDFGTTPYEHDVSPFIPRLYPADGFTQVLYPDATGSALNTMNTDGCDYGCKVTDWNGTWFAMHNPETGLGMIVQHETSTDPVALWVDNDAGSSTNASAVLLLQPSGGFTGKVTETEYLCFYDSGIWTPELALPSGCQP